MFQEAIVASKEIRHLASRASRPRLNNGLASRISLRASVRPIDYMRWAEFEAMLRMLDLRPGQTVLDVASPQWFTLHLAAAHPAVRFSYINILDSEIDPYRTIAGALGLDNLEYGIGDVRNLSWQAASFDKVFSISVLEHIYPAEGGDALAFRDIRRVLRPDGELLLTLPCKAVRGTVYMQGPVYERGEEGSNFFAREYDMDSFHELVDRTDFQVDEEWRIEERPGPFAIDYWEWGEGKDRGIWPWLLRRRGKVERLAGISLDGLLARRHLTVTDRPVDRLVNVAARLKPR